MYFFDTYALIELYKGNPAFDAYRKEALITSMLNVAEFCYALIKIGEHPREVLRTLTLELLEIEHDTAIESMEFRYKNRKLELSMADAIGYTLACKHKLTFLTGDKGFKNLPQVAFVQSS